MMRSIMMVACVLGGVCLGSTQTKAAEPSDRDRYMRPHFLQEQVFARKHVRRAHTRKHYAKRHNSGAHRVARRVERSHSVGRSVSLAGVTPVLVAKAQEIISACGSVVTSARAGRGYRSNHPIGRAVDMQGNPACIKSHLNNWPGGLSTDYWTAPGGPHYHISYNPGGQEWGVRFAHRNPFLHRRYARRHHRVASRS